MDQALARKKMAETYLLTWVTRVGVDHLRIAQGQENNQVDSLITGGFKALWCHARHVMSSYICCNSKRLLSAWFKWSGEMPHKHKRLQLLIHLKCQYKVRKMNKDNLPYVFIVFFCVFVYYICIIGRRGLGGQFQETQNATKTQHAHFKLSPIIYNNVLHTLATQGSHKGK